MYFVGGPKSVEHIEQEKLAKKRLSNSKKNPLLNYKFKLPKYKGNRQVFLKSLEQNA